MKGCGKGPTNANPNANPSGQSPLDKSEVMSDSADDNGAEMMKKEM